MDDLLINGGLAMLLLEGVKWVLRLWVFHNPTYDFPPNFYKVSIPVLNVLVIPVLALLGVSGIVMPTDWVDWVRTALYVGIASLVQVLFYSGYKELKEYSQQYKQSKEG